MSDREKMTYWWLRVMSGAMVGQDLSCSDAKGKGARDNDEKRWRGVCTLKVEDLKLKIVCI